MKFNGVHYRTIWVNPEDKKSVEIIDQRREFLPHIFKITRLKSVIDAYNAIKDMQVRGAGLIGATAGYGMYLAVLNFQGDFTRDFDSYIERMGEYLKSSRPTAVNLAWAVERQKGEINKGNSLEEKIMIAFRIAEQIADEDAEMCRQIGIHGVELIKKIYARKKSTVNILTHCNAGWLAFVDYGSATSPMYEAHIQGIPIHVYVDMTGPWNQGGRLTAWELANEGISHQIIADNTGGHLMRKKLVDMCIVGADRVIAQTGEVTNKIGTYLKALAASDNGIPFYVALPSSTFDWEMRDGLAQIPIESRNEEEVKYAYGLDEETSKVKKVLIANKDSPALNPSFDITPARLVTALITEKGIIYPPYKESILDLYPEKRK